MESVAYFQAISSYEQPPQQAIVSHPLLPALRKGKVSSLAWFGLLNLVLNYALLNVSLKAWAVLTPGSSGTSVSELQNRLKEAGFDPGVVDGIYGRQTEQAVRQFQRARGLTVDGIVGDETLAALRRTIPQVGYSTDTTELQRLLTQRSFYNGPISGIYGSQTRSAVRLAQRHYGLVEDGIAGPATLSALRGGNVSGTPTVARRPRQEIAALQKLLMEQGFYSGEIDGMDGSRTQLAVRNAQRAYGLKVDGIPGAATLGALQGGPPAAASGQSQDNTVKVQRLLTQRGFYAGEIDGRMGPSTRKAIEQAQQAFGLPADGVPGPRTIAALSGKEAPLPVPAPPQFRTGDPVAITADGRVRSYSPSETKRLQRLLKEKGFYQGTVDGIEGPATRDAIRRAQRHYRLVVDGVAGPKTLEALQKR